MTKDWELQRTKQCAKCPWKVDTDPYDIPNYSLDQHKLLENTIARDQVISFELTNMLCHATETSHCIGWIHNQLGVGNNIGLRLRMMKCKNIKDIEVVGQQHHCFEDTLPDDDYYEEEDLD